MRKTLLILGLAACGGGDEAPTCQQGFAHYYDSGCVFVDLATGDVIPEGELAASCQQTVAVGSAVCRSNLDDFLICIGAVPDMSSTTEECDCSREQEDLLAACN